MNDSDKELVERAVSARDLFKHQATRHRLEQSIHNCGAIIAFGRHHEIEDARHDLRLIAGMGEQWQPIETAPKKGPAILVWCAEHKNTYTVIWNNKDHHTDHRPENGLGGYWTHFGGYFNNLLTEVPTHWMPLPEAPREEAV